jgi:hypothetical protein
MATCVNGNITHFIPLAILLSLQLPIPKTQMHWALEISQPQAVQADYGPMYICL